MNWRGIAVLAAVFGWFGGSCLLAEEAAKPGGGCRQGCHEDVARPAPSGCSECEARDARLAEIRRLRAEIAKARQELASLQKPQAPAASAPSGAWLGLQVAEGCAGRLEVTGVADASPAAAAGIQKGDALLLWCDRGVLCVKDLQALAAESKAGDKVVLTVLRGHAWIKAEVTLAADPGAAPAQPAQPVQPAQPAEQPAQPAEPAEQPAEQPAEPAEKPADGQPEEPPPAEEPK
ncbi:MAG: PDZ domain-containing protein [Planctomycetota bacterium]